ncbi:MAG TPA: hypothetical protein VFS43_46495 [Polyangiaceae bacterium]|nr:hypothetical protein [Polyangiaceae bacterium]
MDRDNEGLGGDLEAALIDGSMASLPGAGVSWSTTSEPWLASLRRVLEASEAPLSADGAAQLLGVSSRTMRRYLRSLGTSFQEELSATRGKAPRRAGRYAGRGLPGDRATPAE